MTVSMSAIFRLHVVELGLMGGINTLVAIMSCQLIIKSILSILQIIWKYLIKQAMSSGGILPLTPFLEILLLLNALLDL